MKPEAPRLGVVLAGEILGDPAGRPARYIELSETISQVDSEFVVIVEEGLSVGDLVITSGDAGLKEGGAVRVAK